ASFTRSTARPGRPSFSPFPSFSPWRKVFRGDTLATTRSGPRNKSDTREVGAADAERTGSGGLSRVDVDPGASLRRREDGVEHRLGGEPDRKRTRLKSSHQ